MERRKIDNFKICDVCTSIKIFYTYKKFFAKKKTESGLYVL